MRTRTLLSITLLGLLLWASSVQANDSEDSSEKETETPKETVEDASVEEAEDEEDKEAPQKEKTTEIEEEQDVMVLHINNFDRALSENNYVLVEFYAPWCGHCKHLEPVYAEAAGKLKEEKSALRLAKVNAIEEQELAEEFDVRSFPTLKLFVNGDRKQSVDYTGKRSAEGIIQWMKHRTSAGAAVLDSVESAAQFVEAHNISVVGFFDVSVDRFDDGRADFALSEEGKLDKKELMNFINENSLELIISYNQENSEKIFSSSVKMHSLLFINSTVDSHKELLEEMRTVARELKKKMLFISIDVTAGFGHVLTYFGVSADDAPTVRVINIKTGIKFNTNSDKLTLDSLRQLCQDVLEGNPYFRSEEIPEDWNKGPVKVLVGKNFESVALDPTKNVFVEFYAPWCGHCKELAPTWEKLGEKYADHDDIIIAKMDAIANEIESVKVEGFPTLKYFPAGGKEVHTHRDLETLSKFLDNGGVMPEEEKASANETVKDEL
uniref:protein disulfide-isomerase n=1 Tax=Cynoglossus semilaevis TaxID=244447 RepID=A0A3P8UU97_CYNSE